MTRRSVFSRLPLRFSSRSERRVDHLLVVSTTSVTCLLSKPLGRVMSSSDLGMCHHRCDAQRSGPNSK